MSSYLIIPKDFISGSLALEKSNHELLNRLDAVLSYYFSNNNISYQGLPTVPVIGEKIHISLNYLSSSLKNMTGQNTKQHIHKKLIKKIKKK